MRPIRIEGHVPVMTPELEQALTRLEQKHPQGVTFPQIMATMHRGGLVIAASTVRGYIRDGLLPQSVRIGRGVGQRGSVGIYPTSIVRHVLLIRAGLVAGATLRELRYIFKYYHLIQGVQTRWDHARKTMLKHVQECGTFTPAEVDQIRQYLDTEITVRIEDFVRRCAPIIEALARARMSSATADVVLGLLNSSAGK